MVYSTIKIELMMQFWLGLGILITLSLLQAQTPQLVEWQSQKPQRLINPTDEIQIINFWAAWCAPCRQEIPFLESLQQKSQQNKNLPKLRIIGIALDQTDNIAAFLTTTKVSYPIWQVKGDGVIWMKSMGNPTGGLPFTIINAPKCQYQEKILGSFTAKKWQVTHQKIQKNCTKKQINQ